MNKKNIALILVFLGLISFKIGLVEGEADYHQPIEVINPGVFSGALIANNSTTTHKNLAYNIKISAYSSEVHQTDSSPFTTASNKRVRDGIVAANWLPFGTRVKIPKLFGDKIFVVEDRMHRRNSEKMDIWFESTSAAIKFGVRRATIEIL